MLHMHVLVRTANSPSSTAKPKHLVASKALAVVLVLHQVLKEQSTKRRRTVGPSDLAGRTSPSLRTERFTTTS